MKFKILSFLCILGFYINPIIAQELYEIPLEESIKNSDVIVEGKVISSESEWNKSHKFIQTIYKIEVYKILKGEILTNIIELVCKGGQVGDELMKVTHQLEPETNQKGVFLLKNLQENNYYRAYGNQQGFLRYQGKNAVAPFKTLSTNSLLNEIVEINGESMRIIKDDIENTQNLRTEAPTITSFFPTTINAGNQQVLTINGSGFGAKTNNSNVHFAFADDGGQSFKGLNSYIISWSDSKIETYVPEFAGTGSFIVQNANGEEIKTSSELIIPYGVTEVFDQTDGKFKLPKLVNTNSEGGYSISFSNSMSSKNGAIDAFQRALQTWKCTKNINFQTVSELENVNIAFLDNINLITFDLDNDLPEGVLGKATSYYSGCSINGAKASWSLVEFDIVFASDVDWYFDTELPASNQSDFETTSLHEISHTVQLQHVIDAEDVMHYSAKGGFSRRDLSPVNQAAGDYILEQSSISNSCGNSPMELLTNCESNSVEPVPVALFQIDRTQICVGDSLFLTDKSENTTSRIWTFEGGNPATSTEVSQAIQYEKSGNYQITLTAINETGKDTVSTIEFITIFDIPTVNLGDDITTCSDEEVILKPLNPSSDFTYEWSDGSSEETLKITKSGLYDLTVIQNGCRATDQVQVTINPLPKANYSFQVDSNNLQKIQFKDESENAPSLSWNFGDGLTSSEANPTHEYKTAGDYEVTLTAGNLCGTDVKVTTITVEENPQPTALEAELDFGIKIFPNPSEGKFTLRGKNLEKITKLSVYNMYGQKIVHQNVKKGQSVISLDLSQEAKGIYFLVLEQGFEKSVQKITLY